MNNLSKKILVCVGTRPNLIKITQLEKVFQKYNYFDYILLHTGQHYDNKMNDIQKKSAHDSYACFFDLKNKDYEKLKDGVHYTKESYKKIGEDLITLEIELKLLNRKYSSNNLNVKWAIHHLPATIITSD
jgi:hypothetical protein